MNLLAMTWSTTLRKTLTSACAVIVGLGGATKAWSDMGWWRPAGVAEMRDYVDKRIEGLHLVQLQRQVVDSQIDIARNALRNLDNANSTLENEMAKPETGTNERIILQQQIQNNKRDTDAIYQQLNSLRAVRDGLQ